MYQAPMKPDERVMRALKDLYSAYGYRQYKVSQFEEYDLYVQNKNFLTSEQILTFSDTNGRLMALKPDVTLSIVKNTRAQDAMRKVFYTENVYRVPKNADGFQEIMQTGLECIGDIDDYAMAEVILLAERSLRAIHSAYVLDLSHIGVISGLLAQAQLDERLQAQLLEAMGQKNLPALRTLCSEAALPQGLASALCILADLYGPVEQTLAQARALPLPDSSREALDTLARIAALLRDAGCRNLMLDFSVVNDMDYYNGVVFRGFVDGIASGVLAGGRYDPLLARMGRSQGAIGFAVYLDQLERRFAAQEAYDADVLLCYDDGCDLSTVLRTAQALTEQGSSVRVQRGQAGGLRFGRRLRISGTEVNELAADD